MNDTAFRHLLEPWMATGASQLIVTIPEGSGVFRIIDVPASQYRTGYVSVTPGSFKRLGISGNWYGESIRTCFAEVTPTGTPVYEVTRFNQNTPFLSAFNLPPEIRRAIYDDRDLPSGSFEKSHMVLDFARQNLSPNAFSGVYFPSRRDDNGGIITFDPARISMDFIYTGIKPPPPELFQ